MSTTQNAVKIKEDEKNHSETIYTHIIRSFALTLAIALFVMTWVENTYPNKAS